MCATFHVVQTQYTHSRCRSAVGGSEVWEALAARVVLHGVRGGGGRGEPRQAAFLRAGPSPPTWALTSGCLDVGGCVSVPVAVWVAVRVGVAVGEAVRVLVGVAVAVEVRV